MSDYETIEYRGHTITTGFEDSDMEYFNPRRDDSSNVGVMHCAHRNYTLGDEQTDPEDMTVECPWCKGEQEVRVPAVGVREQHAYGYTDPSTIVCPKCEGEGTVRSPIQWAIEQGATVVLGLYLYDHSGITMSAATLYRDGERVEGGNPFTCRWDSGMVGIMFDTPEGLKERYKVYADGAYTDEWWGGEPPTSETIEAALHGEVRTYDAYLTGDIMYYRTEGPSDDDGCGGFFPDETGGHAYMIEEAKASIDSSIAHAWTKGIEEVQEQRKIAAIMAL